MAGNGSRNMYAVAVEAEKRKGSNKGSVDVGKNCCRLKGSGKIGTKLAMVR